MIKTEKILDAIAGGEWESECIFIDNDTRKVIWRGYADNCPFAVYSCELVSFENDDYPLRDYCFYVHVDDVRRPIIERIKRQ